MEKAYVKAIRSLLESGMKEDEVFTKLHAHLKEAGRTKLLPQLLRELKTEMKREEGREPLLEVGSKGEVRAAESDAKKLGATVEAVVNPDLIAGWRLTTKDTLTDRSGKRALIDLYRTITH